MTSKCNSNIQIYTYLYTTYTTYIYIFNIYSEKR